LRSAVREEERVAGICEGRVVVITGSGRGIGREHALEFARQGAKVVVNDLGAEVDGSGGSTGPAGEVVDLIRGMGGEAVANGDDVASWDGAASLVATAVDAFGGLDTLICNAGILRDRMLVNMTEDDWDLVMKVHLKGHFCPLRHAAAHWREQVKAGRQVRGRVVLTSSGAGLFGNVGQLNYAAAKSGIATMARVAGAELARYGVTVNAIAPAARTRMTESLFADTMAPPAAGEFDAMDPANISPLVVWLGSDDAGDVTGQTFEVAGGSVSVSENWRRGPERDKGDRWEPGELGPVVRDLLAKSEQVPVIGAQ
jgi:NAD(P)-dependent dehydrogenase (short-subunit alcohol dehydrogenase family)